jgi:hypothetical protein
MTMEPLQPYLSWIEVRAAEARSLSAETLLLVIAGCVLVILLLLLGRNRRVGHARCGENLPRWKPNSRCRVVSWRKRSNGANRLKGAGRTFLSRLS